MKSLRELLAAIGRAFRLMVFLSRTFNNAYNSARKRKLAYRDLDAVFPPGPLEGIALREVRNGGRYYGVFTRVAQNLNVSTAAVEQCSRGTLHSKQILKALISEIERVDADKSLHPPALTMSEYAEMQRGGKYYGISSRVANSLGMHPSNMPRVTSGKIRSPRVLTALRAEMARIDAELAAKSGGAA